jgi:hypothetical protein
MISDISDRKYPKIPLLPLLELKFSFYSISLVDGFSKCVGLYLLQYSSFKVISSKVNKDIVAAVLQKFNKIIKNWVQS